MPITLYGTSTIGYFSTSLGIQRIRFCKLAKVVSDMKYPIVFSIWIPSYVNQIDLDPFL